VDGPLIFLVAGEPSGDALGASLMRAIKRETGGAVRFAGVGGSAMEAEGLESLFPMSELAIMGLVEVIPRLRKVLRRIRETAEAVRQLRPDAVVTIDAQAFSYRVARALQPSRCPVIHYVAPTVWAWKPWRAGKVAAVVDRLLLLFPFEKPYWDAVGQDSVFVGHPVAEDDAVAPVTPSEPRTGPCLAVLPGSRTGEIRRHLPLFGTVVTRLAARWPDLQVVIPTVDNVRDLVAQGVADWSVPVTLCEGLPEARRAAMASADAALAVSGTVALDLAAAGTPHVIAYRANPLTVAIVRRMLKVRFVSLVNLIADRPVTPELLQEHCTADNLEAAMTSLIDHADARQQQRDAMADVVGTLRPDGQSPSGEAARAVLSMITR